MQAGFPVTCSTNQKSSNDILRPLYVAYKGAAVEPLPSGFVIDMRADEVAYERVALPLSHQGRVLLY